jgi:hypothetical protein
MQFFSQYQFITSVSKNYGYHSQKTKRLLLIPLLIITMALLSACGGGGGTGGAPVTGTTTNNGGNTNTGTTTTVIANPDTISTEKDIAINIPVLINDSGYTTSSVVSIEGTPSNGNVTILANNTVRYTPDTSYVGTDSFSYQITNGGSIAVATVTVNVQCSSCAPDKIIALSWNPSVFGSGSGYLVYFGDGVSNTKKLAFDLSTATGLDPDAPYIELSLTNDLQLASGDYVCFKVRAYSSSLESLKSAPVCGVI